MKILNKLIILFLLIIFSSAAFAHSYPPEFKKKFYDYYMVNFVSSLYMVPQSAGFSQDSTNKYIQTLQNRIDRKQLESATWACVSAYPPEKFNYDSVVVACFSDWQKNFLEKNKDALNILKAR